MTVLTGSAEELRKHAVDSLLPKYDLGLYIKGKFVRSDATLELKDPYTGQAYGAVSAASAPDVEEAVAAAIEGAREWRALHPRARADYLFRLADAIRTKVEELALLEAMDTGKRFQGTKGWDVPNAAEVYRYYAGWADKISGELLPSGSGQRFELRPEPAGVVAAIVPWNFPFPCTAWKLGPALAAGCAVVLKPSERAPLSGHLLANIVHDIGFPPGVVNVVSGGPEVGRALAEHPGVDRITFTGSSEVAQRIAESVGPRFIHQTLELGGKSPAVVFSDADLDRAAAGVFEGLFDVAGQNCCSTNRVFVHEDIRDDLLSRLRHIASNWQVGDNMSPDTNQGPQIDSRHLERIAGFVSRAEGEGGKDVLGLERLPAPWFAPVLLEGIGMDAELSRDEVFGPVGSIYTFKTDDEALALANQTRYGLAASVWTQSRERITRFTRELRAGTVWVNCFGYFDTVAPWGGRGSSGTGRELGEKAIQEFIEWKTVVEVD